MTKETLAFNDLVETLKSLTWLSVYTETGKAGSRPWSLEISRGPQSRFNFIGGHKKINGYTLTLISNGKNIPADLSEKVGLIDDAITDNRRRGGNALTTIMDDAWEVETEEGREGFAITTNLEIHINEVK